jgi:hypothetical protein
MPHIVFGYYIRNGKAVIDEEIAEKIQKLFHAYIGGLSLDNATKEAGLEGYHSKAGHILQNRHYLGDDFYPAILDIDTFTEAALEREKRVKALGRTNLKRTPVVKTIPMSFRFGESKEYFDDPTKQAQYLYSLIEKEEES